MRLPRLPPSLSRIEGRPAYRVFAVVGTAISAGTVGAGLISAFAHMSTDALIAFAAGLTGLLAIPGLAYTLTRPQPVVILPERCHFQAASDAVPPSVGLLLRALVTNHTGQPLIVFQGRLRRRHLTSINVDVSEYGNLSGGPLSYIPDGETAVIHWWFNIPLPSELVGTGTFDDVLELLDQDNHVHSVAVTFTETVPFDPTAQEDEDDEEGERTGA